MPSTPYSRLKQFPLLLFFLITLDTNAADILSGEKSISLINQDGQPNRIASILFDNRSDKINYKINLDDEKFSNEFLSMRPFKCIHNNSLMVCHLVYPYDKQGFITTDDLTDLEYDLLFLHKSADEYGINAWNGLYYKLQLEQEQITGNLHEVDLNVLAAPPEEGILRPVTSDMLHEADPAYHMYPKLVIN